MNKSKAFSVIIIVLLLALAGLIMYQRSSKTLKPAPRLGGPEELKHSIPLDEIYDGGPGKDGIPSIDHPKFVTIEVAKKHLQPEGLGLAVPLNTEVRFYPYQILVWHELVNDTIGDTPIVVSFCPLCGSGLVFDRRIGGEAVTFGVSGKLYNSDLLMYDRKTDSLWTQLLGQAVVGPLTGTQLRQVEAQVIPFKTFAGKFPKGRVLSKDTGFSRNYERGPYGNYDQDTAIIFPVSKRDNRLHPKARVLGVQVNDTFKAYPVETVKTKNHIMDTVKGHRVNIDYNDGLIQVFDDTTKQNLMPINTFWFAWFAFHPDTELY